MPLPGNSSALPLSYAPFVLLPGNPRSSLLRWGPRGVAVNLLDQQLCLIAHVKRKISNLGQSFQHCNHCAFTIGCCNVSDPRHLVAEAMAKRRSRLVVANHRFVPVW